MLGFASLGSGSRGNATLVADADTCVLVDCGFSLAETRRRLARLGREPSDLAGILVTHEHADHVRGVARLADHYGIPVWLTRGTAAAIRWPRGVTLCEVGAGRPFTLGSLRVEPVAVPHDAREPVQYAISSGARRVGVLTDLGAVTPAVVAHFRHCDGLFLEANHDPRLLATGPYPPALRRRVGGAFGHLSNGQAVGLLKRIELGRIRWLVLGHLSEKNNCRTRLEAAVAPLLAGRVPWAVACQERGVPWQWID